jgi:hypothetical protein
MEAEPPHDILAAEAFAVGEGDQALHREAPHDVLAADEFAVPAPERHALPPDFAGSTTRPHSRRIVALAGLAALVWLIRRR